MAIDVVGRTTLAGALKAELRSGAARVRDIADRVARASVPAGEFVVTEADGAAAGSSDAGARYDVESDMARLADEQARYEATARLLAKAYAGLRSSMQDRS